jgi:DNA-binding IclR family transcriptional regulator
MIMGMTQQRPPQAPSIVSPKAGVPAVEKTVAIIRYLNVKAPGGATLRETVSELNITTSHCHNILRTLISQNWVGYDAQSRRYRLWSGLCTDALSAFSQFEPAVELRPLVSQFALDTGVTCILTRVEPDGTFVVIDKADASTGFGVTVPVGHRFTADAPVQRKAVLAWQSEAAIAAWLDGWLPVAHTDSSVMTRQRMLSELQATRERGYAVSKEEYVAGVMSIGLPIFDRAANPAMVMQSPALTELLAPREHEIARALQTTVTRGHAMIGSRVPPNFRFR